MIGAGAVAEIFGRKRVMAISLAATSLATMLGGAAPNWPTLPRFARARRPRALRPAGGRDGLSRRRDSTPRRSAWRWGSISPAARWAAWRAASSPPRSATSGAGGRRSRRLGAVGLVGAALIAVGLPPSRDASPRRARLRAASARHWRAHSPIPACGCCSPRVSWCWASFVCAYNYIGFRLAAPPFSLSQTAIGLVFIALSRRRGQLDGDGRSRRPLRPPARDVDRHRHRARRAWR